MTSTLCKIFGHKISIHRATGISPKLMKVIERVVYVCDRKNCNYRERHDTPIRDFDMKNGVNLWGSGGVCMGCKKSETCGSSPGKIMLGVKPAYTVLGGFTYLHCPIKEFEIIEREAHRLQELGDVIID